MNEIILFGVGFYILIKGANLLVSGASSIARFFNLSQWAVGIIIVGIGTSIPELAINLSSIFNQTSVGVGTVIGSNTFNILMVIGLCAIVSPLVIRREWVRRDFVFNILAILVATTMISWPVMGDKNFAGITASEGGILLLLFITWLTYIGTRRTELPHKIDYRVFALSTSVIMIVAGFAGVFLGGRWVVSGAELIARTVGISDYLIGLTIIGIGTSIPELVISLVAAFRRNASLAIGNIIGSNIFDFLGILGLTAIFQPIAVGQDIQFDILVTLGSAVILIAAVFVGQRNVLKRWEGGVFVSLYLLYLVFLFWR